MARSIGSWAATNVERAAASVNPNAPMIKYRFDITRSNPRVTVDGYLPARLEASQEHSHLSTPTPRNAPIDPTKRERRALALQTFARKARGIHRASWRPIMEGPRRW